VVVVHDLVEEWAALVDSGVEEPEPEGEGEKIDAAVAANILYISFLLFLLSSICPAPRWLDFVFVYSISIYLMRAFGGGGGGLTWGTY